MRSPHRWRSRRRALSSLPSDFEYHDEQDINGKHARSNNRIDDLGSAALRIGLEWREAGEADAEAAIDYAEHNERSSYPQMNSTNGGAAGRFGGFPGLHVCCAALEDAMVEVAEDRLELCVC